MLQTACERLENEKKRITDFAQVMKSKLENFDELERITKEFQLGLSKVSIWSCLALSETSLSFNIPPIYL